MTFESVTNAVETPDTPFSVVEILSEGLMIAGILFFWGFFAALGVLVSNIGMGRPGSPLFGVGNMLTQLFLLVAVGNALIYVIARGMALSRE